MKKPLDIYASIQDDIISIIQRKYYPDTLWYEWFKYNKLISHKHWKRILYEIYIITPNQYGGDNPVCIDDNILAKKAGITGTELNQTTMFLIELKLVSLESSHMWKITEKGFDVALRNEEIQADKNIKYWFMILASINILIILIQFLIKNFMR